MPRLPQTSSHRSQKSQTKERPRSTGQTQERQVKINPSPNRGRGKTKWTSAAAPPEGGAATDAHYREEKMNLRDKIVQLIQEETKDINLPKSDYKIGQIPIIDSYIYVLIDERRMPLKMNIKLSSNGKFRIEIGGKVRLVNTIKEINQVLNLKNFYSKLSADREKFLERIRKAGLIEINPRTVEDHKIAAFKISDNKIMKVLKYRKSVPLDDRIIKFFYTFNIAVHGIEGEAEKTSCNIKNFNKTFAKFLGTNYDN